MCLSVSVLTRICLLRTVLINLGSLALTHTLTCFDTIYRVRYNDHKDNSTSSYQHYPSFCLPPILPLVLAGGKMSQSCPFPPFCPPLHSSGLPPFHLAVPASSTLHLFSSSSRSVSPDILLKSRPYSVHVLVTK